ncbi:MAG: serine hydrolase [Anaerolineae bacterium]
MNRPRTLAPVTGILVLIVLLLGCARRAPMPTPVPTRTPQAQARAPRVIARPVPTNTPRAVSGASPVARATPTPTRLPRATVTATHRQGGEWPGSEWVTTTPEEQGMDSARLAAMIDEIRRAGYNMHSLTIVRHGAIVADAYLYPYQPGIKHSLYSSTKSIVSALVGIAIAQGSLPGVQATLGQLFPEQAQVNADPVKRGITLEQLLTMTSGLDWPLGSSAADDATLQMETSADWGQYILNRPVADPPGTVWNYSNGGAHLTSIIVEHTTGANTLEFARANLFEPIGIQDVAWSVDPQGTNLGMGGLRLTPHDMARIGYLYLHQGEWNGQQIVPSAWVTTSTVPHVHSTWGWDYGYLWWIPLADTYAAFGSGDQFLIVVPKQGLVVVVTAGIVTDDDNSIPIKLLQNYILPAVQSNGPLPPNPNAQAQLSDEIAAAAAAPPPSPVAPPGDTARVISGKTFTLTDNPLGWQALAFTTPGGNEARLTLTANGQAVDLRVGLDGDYRLTDGIQSLGNDYFDGPIAARGTWQDEHTLALELQPLGWADRYNTTLAWQGGRVTVTVHSLIDGTDIEMEGR